ncbi:MAG: hypothetical protein ACFB12_08145 [Leptolyngbyaceae cyanobacterium]
MITFVFGKLRDRNNPFKFQVDLCNPDWKGLSTPQEPFCSTPIIA